MSAYVESCGDTIQLIHPIVYWNKKWTTVCNNGCTLLIEKDHVREIPFKHGMLLQLL